MKRIGPMRIIWRGLTRRCARCGSGKLFHRYFSMVERCPKCNVKFEREAGFFLGAYTMNLAFMIITAMLVIFVGFAVRKPGGSIIPMMIAGGIGTLILPPLLYPFSKTLWCSVDLLMQRALGKHTTTGTHNKTGSQ
jgi:uncharacterized protein (DUF983 family)